MWPYSTPHLNNWTPIIAFIHIFVQTVAVLSLLRLHLINCDEDEQDHQSLLRKCYDSPSDLFQVYPQLNSTFKIKIKNKCLQLPSLEIYLFIFDLSIVNQIFSKEVDQLDSSKLNSLKINRPAMIFGRSEMTNFNLQSKFKFGIVFFDQTGVVDIALYPKVFNFFSYSTSSSAEVVLIIVLGVLLAITFILLGMLIYINYFGNGRLQSFLIFWQKDDNRKLIKDQLSSNEESFLGNSFETKSHSILVSELLNLIPPMLENDSIKNEYNSIPKCQLFSWNYSKLPEHRTKNRYGNLLAYDHSRVILSKESSTDLDYINANFIDGYKKANRYIAMQGPIDTTVKDFWHCVWQFKCHQIIMLTNLEESGKTKCTKYWPDISQYYGMVKVTLQKTELLADYVIRIFLVEKQNEKLSVIHYHFVSWPDHAVPLYACTLVSFINRIRSSSLYKQDVPMIVHCSAGIGRTGAFILIDTMLEMAKKEKRIDILNHFCKMRLQRFNMVEKMSQYIFVYQVLFEALSHEPTNIGCPHFESYFSKLLKGGNKMSMLSKQFEILNSISLKKLSPDVCKFGLLNFKFNRRQDVVPPDYARVILPNLNEYVNALYVNGYRKQDAFIVTQIPFENNRKQFWKMIENTGTNTIVLLSEVGSDNDVYWPCNVNQKLEIADDLAVCLQKEEMSNNLIVRTFVLKPAEMIVRQFHLRCLSANNLAKHPSTPLLLIELKEKLDQSNIGGNAAPLVIQCIDGVQFSGLFCAADFIFERIKEEQQIDVFLAVQKVRTNRPQFITNYDQYLYLHQVALAFLNSFDEYANFK